MIVVVALTGNSIVEVFGPFDTKYDAEDFIAAKQPQTFKKLYAREVERPL